MSTLRIRIRSRAALAVALAVALDAASLAAQESAREPPVGVPAHGTLEDPFNRAVLLDEIEAIDGDDGTALRWDVGMWAGYSLDKLSVRSEGKRAAGDTEEAELQFLWTHAVGRWWDVVTGIRTDFAPGPGRSWAAFGVQGLAPYRFEVAAKIFVADEGDTAARIEAEYEILITPRLILQPQIELDWYGQSDARRAHASGLSSGEFALRLRYEVRREVAPYVGLVRERLWGDSAHLARAAGHDADDTRFVAGLRVRF
jgi:copper resistance protein B